MLCFYRGSRFFLTNTRYKMSTAHRLVGKTYETTDYSVFKKMKGNRDPKETNIRRIQKSIRLHSQKQAILVNERMEVADGQTRLEAAKREGLPIKYTISEGITIADVTEINNQTHKWNPLDYAKSFADRGSEDYKLYNEFRLEYPNLTHQTLVMLLVNSDDRNAYAERKFKEGQLTIKSWNKANKVAKFITKIAQYYEGFNRRSFIAALMKIMQHDEFSEERLLRKLKSKSNLLKDYSKTEDYLTALESAYNWKEVNRIRFY